MVGIVVVSHSARLAEGVVELAAQMAAGVPIVAAGGDDEGGMGTSLDKVNAALAEADTGDGVVVLYDLGSAQMTAEMAIDLLGGDRVRLVDAPLVEGALAAGTEAAGGADLDAVAAAAAASGGGGPAAAPTPDTTAIGEPAVTAEVTLVNPLGLHARPAAQLVSELRGFDAAVRLTNTATGASADGNSLLSVVGLAASGGVRLAVEATGPDAAAAVDRVVALVESGFGELRADGDEAGAPPQEAAGAAEPAAETAAATVRPEGALVGAPGAPGIAIGRAVRLTRATPDIPDTPADSPAAERARLADAIAATAAELERRARGAGGGIFAAHRELLDDPELREAVEVRLRAGDNAAQAWWTAVSEIHDTVAGLPGEVFAARAADIADVGRQVLDALLGAQAVPQVPSGAVVVADDLVPSAVGALVTAGAAGVVLRGGAPTAHATVLARTAELPLVLRLGDAVDDIADGALLVLDGDAGSVAVDPPAEVVDAAVAERDRRAAERTAAIAAAAAPVTAPDGERVVVAANAATAAEARAAVERGAEGIGLLRTEFLFTERATLPSEEEQVEALAAVIDALDGRPAIVRTLDVGGDKPAPALGLDPVRNGFLGQRGLRLSLARPDVFATQLRAILRVAEGRRVSVMFPFVTTVDEVRRARRALEDARRSLQADGIAAGSVEEVGIMVEIPAAALAAADFVDEVDFFSVGSNDLVQYLMAADRTIAEVADHYRPDADVVIDLIGRVCAAARAAGRWVGVCGEMAADPDLAVRLVDVGVRELSMVAAAIPAVKERLRRHAGV